MVWRERVARAYLERYFGKRKNPSLATRIYNRYEKQIKTTLNELRGRDRREAINRWVGGRYL
jgi:hypothetical protein